MFYTLVIAGTVSIPSLFRLRGRVYGNVYTSDQTMLSCKRVVLVSKVISVRLDEALAERLDAVRQVVPLQAILEAVADAFDRLQPKEPGPFLYALRHAGETETTSVKAANDAFIFGSPQEYFRLGYTAASMEVQFRGYLLESGQYLNCRSVAVPLSNFACVFDGDREADWLKKHPALKAELAIYYAKIGFYDQFAKWWEED